MKKNFKYTYILILISVVIISSIGATYAYFATSSGSKKADITTSSEGYNISMKITPVYDGFSTIPLDDENVIKAINNKCKDKYNRGACSVYSIKIDGYDENLDFISGIMNTTTNNIENLSYMVLEEKDNTQEQNCVVINDKSYCISKEATRIIVNTDLSLGDKYDVTGTTEKNFLLVIWLSNIEMNQNENDIGTFQASITFSMGNGGQIKGTIVASGN